MKPGFSAHNPNNTNFTFFALSFFVAGKLSKAKIDNRKIATNPQER